jgi:FkbM family methyltransferase
MRDRPRDINLQCAAGASNGEIEVWECDVRGWATASADVMAQHKASGHKGVSHKGPVSRLADICARHVSGEIHFLKIDVEGFEKSVIDGADFSRFRPWILVIEATRPNSTEEIHEEWENSILAADYVLAYTDGLNRFYVAKEHGELLASLRYPPNVFDGFTRSEQLDSELRAQQAENKAQQAENKAQQAENKARQAENKAQQAQAQAQQAAQRSEQLAAELGAVYASQSWRITRPLRWLARRIRTLRNDA